MAESIGMPADYADREITRLEAEADRLRADLIASRETASGLLAALGESEAELAAAREREKRTDVALFALWERAEKCPHCCNSAEVERASEVLDANDAATSAAHTGEGGEHG